jgi:hypothetical protein
MKRWVALVAVFCTVVMAGSGVIAPCWADQLISFTDTNPDSWSLWAVFSNDITGSGHCASWTQTVTTTNTSIGAIVGYIDPGPGEAWLTNAVGPGTTPANVIDSTTFTAPVLTGAQSNNFNIAPMTSLFSGLTLNPGTYYLILGSNPWTGGFNWWVGGLTDPANSWSDVVVNTAAGFTEGPIGFSDTLSSFLPSQTWQFGDSYEHLIYTVEGTVVPLPPTVWLLGSSLLGLAGWRRFRKS